MIDTTTTGHELILSLTEITNNTEIIQKFTTGNKIHKIAGYLIREKILNRKFSELITEFFKPCKEEVHFRIGVVMLQFYLANNDKTKMWIANICKEHTQACFTLKKFLDFQLPETFGVHYDFNLLNYPSTLRKAESGCYPNDYDTIDETKVSRSVFNAAQLKISMKHKHQSLSSPNVSDDYSQPLNSVLTEAKPGACHQRAGFHRGVHTSLKSAHSEPRKELSPHPFFLLTRPVKSAREGIEKEIAQLRTDGQTTDYLCDSDSNHSSDNVNEKGTLV